MPSSMAGGCPSVRQVARWARSRRAYATPLRAVESSCAGTARASLSSGPCLPPKWTRSTRESNSHAATLHVFGPATAASFARWAGIQPATANAVVKELAPTLSPVRTPVGRRVDPRQG